MIDFRYGRTMTVKELRDLLATYQEDSPVFATWEGVNAYIDPDNFYVKSVTKEKRVLRDCIVIDVEGY